MEPLPVCQPGSMSEAPSALSSPRLITTAAVVVIALGAFLRLWGMTTCEVWADEAWWANKLLEGQVGWIRPPGYMWLTKQIISLDNTEVTLRSLSMLAALVQLPLFFLLMRRLVSPWIAVAATFLLAVHPAAVAFAKEFKPYALESCLHTALILLAVRYVDAPRTRTLVAMGALAALSPPLSWSTVFLYPGLFLATGLHALRGRRMVDVGVAVAGVVATLAVLGVIFAMRLRDANPHPEYWGKAYGVFYLGDSVVDGLRWYAEKTANLMSLPGKLRLVWGFVPSIEPTSLVLGIVGVVALLVRRTPGATLERALLLALPWGVFVVFNIAGQWPYGVFRTNLFMLAYAIMLIAMGLHTVVALLQPRFAKAPVVVGGIVALLLLQALPVKPDQFACKGPRTMASNASVLKATRLLQETVGTPPRPTQIVFDGQACSALTYYRLNHSGTRDEVQAFFSPPVDVRCSVGRDPGYIKLLDEVMAGGGSFFAVLGKHSTAEITRARVVKECPRHGVRRLRGTYVYWCGRGDEPAPDWPKVTPPPPDTATDDDD